MADGAMTPGEIESAAQPDMAALGSGHAGGVVQTCPKVTLEIGVFFDGTGNNEQNAQTGGEGSYANARSNVSLLKDLYWNDGDAYDQTNACGGYARRYRSLYVQGIGTETGEEDDVLGSAMGVGPRGVENRVIQAALEVGRMINRLSPGVEPEEVIIDVFGFSRGAAAARHFVNGFNAGKLDYKRTGLIDLVPLLGWTNDIHARLPADRNVNLRFVGIFDTVAAILADLPRDNGDVDVHLKDSSAQKIYHLTADDEIRHNFSLSDTQNVGEVERMAGVHSDVGGGYPAGFDERPVIRMPHEGTAMSYAQAQTQQQAMIAQLRASMLADAAVYIAEGWITPADLPDAWELEATPIETRVVAMGRGMVRNYYSWKVKTRLNRPWVRHELARLSLEKMHQKAEAFGLPLKPYPASSSAYYIPNDVRSASAAEKKRVFTHYSSNYNDVYPIIGSPMKERSGRKRKVHLNKTGLAK